MDEGYAERPLARWFWAGAVASLLFMAFGCLSYLFHVTLDPATLPLDQRAVFDALPMWMTVAFAIAVWVGLVGAVMLLLRRKLAEPLLLVSLVAATIQFSAYFLHPPLRDATPPAALATPIAIILLVWTIYWFARHSRQRGWLR